MNAFDLAKSVITTLNDKSGVSGYEHNLIPILKDIFCDLNTEVDQDDMGNFYAYKKGETTQECIMLAAHFDEIGLMVTHIDKRGFLHFTTVGGIDARTLLHQAVVVHGTEDVVGIISCIPPEKYAEDPQNKAIENHHLVIDIGHSHAAAHTCVKPGDIISLKRSPFIMRNNRMVSKALDDRAGVAVLAVCMDELCRRKHHHAVFAVATVQEEVGLRGAITSSNRVQPSLALAVDVTHAQTLDTKNQVSIQLGKGPVITIGPNIHPGVYTELTNAAKESKIPYQIQPVATATGTDARVLQLTGRGIPTALVSIPLRYMHTSVETASLQDIVDCGKLLAAFIAGLPENLEDLLCC